MKRFNKLTATSVGGQPTPASDHGSDAFSRTSDCKCGFSLMKLTGIVLVFVMGFSVLFSVSVVLRDPPSDGLWTVVEARNLDLKIQRGTDFLVFLCSVLLIIRKILKFEQCR